MPPSKRAVEAEARRLYEEAGGVRWHVTEQGNRNRWLQRAIENLVRSEVEEALREKTGEIGVALEEAVQEIEGADEDGLDLPDLAARLTGLARKLDLLSDSEVVGGGEDSDLPLCVICGQRHRHCTAPGGDPLCPKCVELLADDLPEQER